MQQWELSTQPFHAAQPQTLEQQSSNTFGLKTFLYAKIIHLGGVHPLVLIILEVKTAV
jgi:hypothetical protein